jgi:hypothetical protein
MQQQPGILEPAEADSPSIGRRRFTEALMRRGGLRACWAAPPLPLEHEG